MGAPLRIGIAGYGNLGRGVVAAVDQNTDMELVGIFTRRSPEQVTPPRADVPVLPWDELLEHRGGHRRAHPVRRVEGRTSPSTARPWPPTSPPWTASTRTRRSPSTSPRSTAPARAGGHTAIISVGWDPGMFSVNRLLGEALLPDGETYTFWGKGLSQGHSDAVRRVAGVAGGVQYTVPSEAAIEAVRSGRRPELTTREKHTRECYVVLEDGADAAEVERAIVTMPHYFAEYDTTVTLHQRRGAGPRPRRDAARRVRHPQRQHRDGQLAGGGVPPRARQQPRVHRQRAGRLRPGRGPPRRRGAGRRQDGVRRRRPGCSPRSPPSSCAPSCCKRDLPGGAANLPGWSQPTGRLVVSHGRARPADARLTAGRSRRRASSR